VGCHLSTFAEAKQRLRQTELPLPSPKYGRAWRATLNTSCICACRDVRTSRHRPASRLNASWAGGKLDSPRRRRFASFVRTDGRRAWRRFVRGVPGEAALGSAPDFTKESAPGASSASKGAFRRTRQVGRDWSRARDRATRMMPAARARGSTAVFIVDDALAPTFR